MPDQFCDLCDVSLDLHDGPDTCDLAERKAVLLGIFAATEPPRIPPVSSDGGESNGCR